MQTCITGLHDFFMDRVVLFKVTLLFLDFF
jgi:hypothetical protein